MNLLMRRREMMIASSSPTPPIPEWDYIWEYTDGLPPTADGWATVTSGTGSYTLESDGLKIVCNNSSYRYYQNSQFSMTTGVAEAVLNVPSSGTTTGGRAFFRLGNSNICLWAYFGYYSSARRIKLLTNTTFANGTNIGTFSYDTNYTLTLIINNGIGTVKLNGSILKDNVDMSTMKYPGVIRFGAQNAGGKGAIWKSIKIKKNRLQ